jgi:hypothetical protein
VQIEKIIPANNIEFRDLSQQVSIDNIENYIVIQSFGRIGSCGAAELISYGNFDKNNVGDILVEGKSLDLIQEGESFRYLKNFSSTEINLDQFSTNETVTCSLQSTIPSTFASFEQEFSFPLDLCSTSSIGDTEILSKNADLTINWNPDDKTDFLYVVICSPGIPCIIQQFPDTGAATIPSSTFVDLISGERVFMYIGRGVASIIEQNDGNKIGILRVQTANYPGLYVE